MRATRIYLIVLATLIGNVSGVLALMVVARFMGPNILGMIAYWLAFTSTFSFPVSLDLDSAHLRIVPMRESEEEKSHAIGAFASLKLILILASIGTMLVAFFVQSTGGSSGTQDRNLFLLFALSVTIAGCGTVFSSTFAAFSHTAKQQLPLLTGTVTRSCALVLVVVVSGSVLLLGGAYVIGALMSLLMALFLFRRHHIAKARRSDFREYLKLSGPLMAAPIFTMAIYNVDKIVLGISFDSSIVGVYYLIQTIAFSLLLIGRAARVVLIPGFSQDLRDGRIEIVREQSQKVARFVSMLFVPLIAFALFFSGPYLGWVFGESFKHAGPAFAVILAGVWVSLLSDPLTSFITAKGTTIIILFSNIIGFAISLTLLLILVPESIGGIGLFGLAGFGAAVAFCVSTSAQTIYYRHHAREIRTYFPLKTVMKTVATTACAVVIGVVLLDVSATINFRDVPLVILPVLFFGVTILGVYYMKELSRSDIHYIRQVVSTRSMVGYVRDELTK